MVACKTALARVVGFGLWPETLDFEAGRSRRSLDATTFAGVSKKSINRLLKTIFGPKICEFFNKFEGQFSNIWFSQYPAR
jgi:hypothetical protein